MAQYDIHRHLNELLQLLDISNVAPDAYVDLLVKSSHEPHTISQASALSHVKKLAERSSSSREFIAKYDELKVKNTHDLDSIIYLLHKLGLPENSKVKSFLGKNAQARFTASPVSASPNTTKSSVQAANMTPEEFLKYKDQLQKNVISQKPVVTASPKSKEKAAKKQSQVPIPSMQKWKYERPFLTMDFINGGRIPSTTCTLAGIPVSSQERIIIEELLYCLVGIDGDYVVSEPVNRHATRNFIVDDFTDCSLLKLMKRVLPLCSNYSTVARFIEENSEFGVGMVNNALAAAMRSIVKDYLVFISQLEHQHRQGALTLQKLWFYVQPTLKTMDILTSIVNVINKGNLSGGAVLRVLHEKTTSYTGDSVAQDLCFYLTQLACVPYFEILENWIYRGIILDPYNEFMVEDNEIVQMEDQPLEYSDDYWEKRYRICRESVPSFLEKIADIILRTGKYLNVIRQCGQDVKVPHADHVSYTLNEREYADLIEKSYSFASKQLLNVLIEDCDLMGRLRSVKHYFLLDQGDFIVQFLDMADDELKKNVDVIMPTRLESLLELALRTSVVNNDPYKDDVIVALLPYDLVFQMCKILSINKNEEKQYWDPHAQLKLSGLEAFAFDYEVKWPLSLILNRRSLACYQMLLRHLLYSKHVERLLCSVWVKNKVAKCFPLATSQGYSSAFALRQRMLNFIQNLEYYMMFEVLEPNWQEFITKLTTVSDVDAVLKCHSDFLDACLKDCMLTNPDLVRIVNELASICVKFSNFILERSQMDTCSISGSVTSMSSAAAETTLSFEQEISRYEKEFTQRLVLLMHRISDQGKEHDNDKLVTMLYRLDFNGFYSTQLEKLAAERSVHESRNTEFDSAACGSVDGASG